MQATMDFRRDFTGLVVPFVAGSGLVTVGSSLTGDDPAEHAILIAIANVVVIALIAVFLRTRDMNLSDLGVSFDPVPFRRILASIVWSVPVFVVGTLAFVVTGWLATLVTGSPQQADTSAYNAIKVDAAMLIMMLPFVWIFTSFAEEVIYRGFLITWIQPMVSGVLNDRAATIASVLLAGCIFGAVHYAWGFAGMLQAGAMGIVMGLAYVYLGRRLWLLVLAHAYMDTLLFVQVYLA
jgi:membrane protease YdiL (CAAX protease family)